MGKETRNVGLRPRALAVALAVALPLLFAGGVAQAKGLREAVETALTSNPRIYSADAVKRAAEQDVRRARAGYFPTIDLSAGVGPERTDTPGTRLLGGDETLTRSGATLQLSQMLFDGMATSSEVERQRARLDGAAALGADAREVLALQVTEAYLAVLRGEALVALSEQNLEIHRQTLEKVRIKVRGGLGQKADLQQAQGRVALAQSTLTARQGALRESREFYVKVVGEQAGKLSEPEANPSGALKNGAVDPALLEKAIRDAADSAVAENPRVRAATAEVSAAEASVRVARSAYMPRLSLDLVSTREKNVDGIEGRREQDAAMLQLRWNLFRGGADQAQEKANAERRYAAIDEVANVRREVTERVAAALTAKATSEQRRASLEEHVAASVEVVEAYRAQFELGRRSLLDVLNAEAELFSARSSLADARYNDILSYYASLAARGTLVKSLGVAAPELEAREDVR